MSVVNLHIADGRVWAAWDTMQVHLDGTPHSFASKGSLFLHLYALAGFRGLAQLHHRFDCWMNGGGRVLDVEDAAERLPDQLRGWRAELFEDHPDHRGHIKGEIFLAGWRPRKKAFGGWHLSSDQDFAPVEMPVPSTTLNPGCADVGYVPPAMIDDPDKLVRCCQVQKSMVERNIAAGGSDLGIGGEVILCQLTTQGFTVKKAHRFDDFAEVKEMLRNG